MDGAGASTPQTYYQDTTAFGVPSAIGGTEAGAFKFGGANGCQTDADTGLVLMGHRYYDPRTGRFITQDPAAAGSNWYEYTYNNPMNGTDPMGLDAPLGDFGLGADQAYAADPINSARAGLTAQMNQSAGLIAQFQYYSVDKVTFYTDTKMIIYTEHLFDFAVPVGTSIIGNYYAALNYANTHHAPAGIKALVGVGLEIRDKAGDAAYVRHHFANDTVGDFKDKNFDKIFSGLGQPRPGTRLYELADDGGNMNGGMGMEGLGMSSWEVAKSGDAHIAWQSKGTVLSDDARGAAVLQVGWNYATQLP